MDGALIVTIITSSVAVGGAIGSGFWKLGRAIGHLEGKVESFKVQMQDHEKRLDRLDRRINGFLDSISKTGD